MKGVPGRQTRGIPTGARLECIDNTGAKIVQVVSVPTYHGTKRRYPSAALGEMMVVTVKKGSPETRKQLMRAVIVRQKRPFRRPEGTMVQFEDNAVVIVTETGETKGTDIKGPVACHGYAPAVLRDLGVQPAGDLYVTSVVMEELGGVGARLLLESLRPDLVVIGEASGCRLARGHRGRVELTVTFTGRSAHASAPERGANPHYAAARLLAALPALHMATDPELGPASVAPTLYRTDQVSPNVIPGVVRLTLDWRSVPAESVETVLARLAALAAEASGDGVTGQVDLRTEAWRTYTGLERALPSVAPGFRRAADDPLVTTARALLADALAAPVPDTLWRFATDGGHFAAAGIPTIGFGPGEEALAHTTEERIDLDALERGLAGYAALAAHLGEMNA